MPQVMLNSHIEQWGENNELILRNHFPLHRACRDGDLHQLSLLVGDGQCAFNAEDSIYGWTPFHWATHFGKLDCLRRLLSLVPGGQNIISSKFKQSPVHAAALSGQVHCLHYLLQVGADVNLQDYMGETPLHKAARSGHTECASLLVAMGADTTACNLNGQTPSQLAYGCGHLTLAGHLSSAEHQPAKLVGLIGSNNGTSNGFLPRNLENGAFPKANGRVDSNSPQQLQNGFRLNGLKESARINGSTELMNCGNGFTNGRKRSFDSWGCTNGKRIRTLESDGLADLFAPSLMPNVTFGVAPAAVRQEQAKGFQNHVETVGARGGGIMDSMIEHQTLCSVERGYNSMLLESIISQMHGC